jgi:hypothetical protein
MTDQQLSDLFAEGSAPERDPAFMLEVIAEIGRARLRTRLQALALRMTVLLLLAVALFMASRLISPVLAQLVEGLPQLPQFPQFMGVPVPGVLLGAIVAALALRGRLHLSSLLRFAPPPP